jgi:hypothetical protein
VRVRVRVRRRQQCQSEQRRAVHDGRRAGWREG